MLGYLFSLIGLTALCALWVVFQLWLKRQEPNHPGLNVGCGACKSGSCSTDQCN